MTGFTGATLFAAAIKRQGVRSVFGLCGHLDIFFGALDDVGVRVIGQRHEAAVIHAADGYSRASRGLGVAIVTAGPGLANAVGGIASAYNACSPLLIIAGRNPIETADLGRSQDLDHHQTVRAITKWSATVYDAARLGEYVDTAARIALEGRPGPVLLDVPNDLQAKPVSAVAAEEYLGPLLRPTPPAPDPLMIDQVADLIMSAERPLLIAGGGAHRANADAPLQRLAEEFGLPVAGKLHGRGLVPEDLVLGFGWPLAQAAARHADLVIVFGARFNRGIGYGRPPVFSENARFVQIDVDGANITRNRSNTLPIVADAASAATALGDALQRKGFKRRGNPTWVNDAIAERIEKITELSQVGGDVVRPMQMARELQARLPENAVIVGDGAACLNSFLAVFRIGRGGSYFDNQPFGCMGVGVPLAMGVVAAEQDAAQAGVRDQRPVFLTTGDGAFGFYAIELSSASYNRLPFFTMIANDGGWGANRGSQRQAIGRNVGTDFAQNRYDQLAQALDCYGELVTRPEDLGAAFDRSISAVQEGKPAVVNVLIDPSGRDTGGMSFIGFNHAFERVRQRLYPAEAQGGAK